MGANYLKKAKLNSPICKKVKSTPLNSLSFSSEQEYSVSDPISTLKVKKFGKCQQHKQSITNKTDQISWSKVYTSPVVAKRRKYRDIDDKIEESNEKSTLYSLDEISGTDTVLEGPKERGDCAAVETQTIVSSATLKLVEKRRILNRISFPKLRCLCCCSRYNDRPTSTHDADSFESIDITTPQSDKISTFYDTVYNIARHSGSLAITKRIKFNIKVAQILNKVTLHNFRKTSKELLKAFKTFSYVCNV